MFVNMCVAIASTMHNRAKIAQGMSKPVESRSDPVKNERLRSAAKHSTLCNGYVLSPAKRSADLYGKAGSLGPHSNDDAPHEAEHQLEIARFHRYGRTESLLLNYQNA